MRFRPLVLASAIALACASQGAWAECYGFTDTNVDLATCNAIEWLKNRSITLGCGGTDFCPDTNVSRWQMALFMQRLGKAMTPTVLYQEYSSPSNFNVSSPPGGVMLCQVTDPYTVVGYPRTARFSANVYGVPQVSAAWLVGFWKYSTDDGLTWNVVPNSGAQRDWAAYGQVAQFNVMAAPMDLAVGTTYRFALFGSGNSGNYAFFPFACQLEVSIYNRVAATSPLDE